MAQPDTSFMGQALDVLRGLNAGATTDLVGAPVDIINMGLQAVDATKILPQRFSTEAPVGGSEWLRKKLQGVGMAHKLSGTPTENMARMLGMFGVNPASVGRTGLMAEKAVARIAEDSMRGPARAQEGIFGERKAAERIGGKTLHKFLAGEQALKRGEPSQDVWRKYGVEMNKEGQPSFEFPPATSAEDLLKQIRMAYPDMTLKVLAGKGKYGGWFDHESSTIFARGKDLKERRSVLEHEVQHAVDKHVGFSYGSNLKDPHYWETTGEVRARNAQARLEDPDLRRFTPELTEDSKYPREKQIIKGAK